MKDKKLSSVIEGEEYLVLHEFVKKAKEKLSIETWDYLIGGSETETTFKISQTIYILKLLLLRLLMCLVLNYL